MKIKRKYKVKVKYFMVDMFDVHEIEKPKPGELMKVDSFDTSFYQENIKVRIPNHRDVLAGRREGYRTRRNMSSRRKSKLLLVLRSEEMLRKQRLKAQRVIEMERYLEGQHSQYYDCVP
jgi:hypothetical protein